jgi:uncharacterized phage infection (PIP) family protein YhgE
MTQFNLARLSRRTGGLDRLANEYQQQIAAMTDQYSKGFSEYQRRVGEQMAPFEAAMAQYQQVAQPQYQQQLAEYNAKLEAYQRQLAELEKEPVIERTGTAQTRTWYGKKKTQTFTYYEPKEIPTFSAQAPTAPDIPQAPQVEAFDSSQFEAKRGQLGQTMQREVGERRAARLNVVRRGNRTMLQGEKA